MRRCFTIILLSACLVPAAERANAPRGRRFWLASVAALVAAHAVDVHSSWGQPERNPLLQSGGRRFGGSSVGIKAGIVGAVVAVQCLALRRTPDAHRAFTVANLAGAGAMAGIAARNYATRQGSLTAPLK